MSLYGGNVRLCITGKGNAFSRYVADSHFVVNIEVPRDNVPAVELVANDAGANGVAAFASLVSDGVFKLL